MLRRKNWVAPALFACLLGCSGGAGTGSGAPSAGAGASLLLSGPPVVVDLSQPAPTCPEPPPPAAAPKEQPAFLIQRNHSRPIAHIALSGDGRVMATAASDGTVRVWDTSTGLLIRRILTEGMQPKIVLSRSGTMLAYYAPDATIGGTTTISLVDLTKSAPPRSVTQYGEMALSPDGKLFAVALTSLTLYDADGKKLKELDLGLKTGHIALSIAVDDAMKTIAVGSASGVVIIDVPGWKVERIFPMPGSSNPMNFPLRMAFSGDKLVLADIFGAVQIVDRQGTPTIKLPGASYSEIAVAGPRLWSIDRGAGKLEAWDATTGMSVPFRTSAKRPAEKIAASADGSTLALVATMPPEGNGITLQDGATGAVLRELEGPPTWITALAIRPDGAEITTGSNISSLTRWSLVDGDMQQASLPSEMNQVESIAYDGAGAQVAWTLGTYFVRVRDARTGRVVRQWKPHGDKQVIFAGFLPKSTDLITAARDGSVARWDLSGLLPPRPSKPFFRFDEVEKPPGKPLGSIGHPARRAALSADGAWIALDDNTGSIGVLSTQSGAVRWDTSAKTHVAWEKQRWISFTPDGSRLLLSGVDLLLDARKMQRLTPSLRSFDASSGALVAAVFPETHGPVAALGDIVAVGGFRPALLDAATLSRRASIPQVDREVTAIVAHPKRRAFVMSGDGGATILVGADKGRLDAVLVATAGGDYMTATPEGAFLSSLDGARSVAWAFASPPESFGFDQFASQFARPELVKRRLAGDEAEGPSNVSRPPRIELDAEALAKIAPSELGAKGAPPVIAEGSLSVRATVASDRRVERVRAFVNGRPAADQLVCSSGGTVELNVPLQGGRNRVNLIAYDADGYASNPQKFDIVSTAPSAPRPDLWVLSVGVSRYANLPLEHQLEYADDDARSVAEALAGQVGPGKPFAALHATTLLDAEVTVEGLERAVEGLSAMRPDDLAVVFLAGHGLKVPGDKMVFLTAKAEMNARSALENGVGWDRIQAALGRAKGRVVVLLDACHSGHVSTDIIAPNESLAQDLASRGRAGVLVFAAARGSQFSYEVPPSGPARGGSGAARGLELVDEQPKPLPPSLVGGHGLFTSALLEAMAGGVTDRDRSGAIEMAELMDFVTWRVKSTSSGAQTPWIARREMFGDFAIAPAGR